MCEQNEITAKKLYAFIDEHGNPETYTGEVLEEYNKICNDLVWDE